MEGKYISKLVTELNLATLRGTGRDREGRREREGRGEGERRRQREEKREEYQLFLLMHISFTK